MTAVSTATIMTFCFMSRELLLAGWPSGRLPINGLNDLLTYELLNIIIQAKYVDAGTNVLNEFGPFIFGSAVPEGTYAKGRKTGF